MTTVAHGQQVKLVCASYLEDGTCIEEFDESRPITVRAGLKGKSPLSTLIAERIVGMDADQVKLLEVEPAMSFGESEPRKVFRLPVDPNEETAQVGDEMTLKVGEGSREELVDGVVVKVTSDTITVDTNHPLAGKRIVMKVRVLSIKP